MKQVLALVAALLFGCGDSSGPGGGGGQIDAGGSALGAGGSGGAGASSLEQLFAESGFAVQASAFSVLDLSSCCDEGKNCAGNNPTSPYGAFYVPSAPDQAVPEEHAGEDGKSNMFRLRPDEAIVYVGETPPAAAYFGFTAYVMERTYAGGDRRTPFASLGETLNNGVVADAYGEAFSVPLAVIVCADAGTEARAREALLASGVETAAIHTLVIDSSQAEMGLELDDATFGVLFRYALPDDPAAAQTYLEAIPGAVYRLTPEVEAEIEPLPPEAPRTKGTVVEDPALVTALDALEAALRAAHPDVEAQSMLLSKGEPDPQACIDTGTGCAGDNRDTNYPATLPQPFFTEPGELYWVIGVDHRALGKVAYGNFSFYALEHLVGIAGVSDREYAGSASAWLPDEPLAEQLFAWKIARDCGGEASCTEIPVAACPDGLADGALATIAFRTYLEPQTNTAPDIDTLVESRVLRFRP